MDLHSQDSFSSKLRTSFFSSLGCSNYRKNFLYPIGIRFCTSSIEIGSSLFTNVLLSIRMVFETKIKSENSRLKELTEVVFNRMILFEASPT